ncbi:MAG: alpha-ketoacid dehydrogenase subunit beta [Magnetococcales bacterium]|nr:alpha-ketoacid dehydrogenase subunit beta [Magnetococcales bacterium]
MSLHNGGERSLTFAQAIQEAMAQEMERDPTVFVLGQGVDDPIGFYGTTLGLAERFGSDRCFDTPLSEDAVTGMAIGAALAGLRPINTHQRMDFLLLCMNQLVNIAAKSCYMFAGAMPVPLVVRGVVGRSWGQGPQHSQAFHSYFMHVPGIKVFAPSLPYDAKGCMVAAIRDNNPVLIMEHRMLFNVQGPVPEHLYETPFGQARVLRSGDDITLVAIGHMVMEASRAARQLAEEVGIAAEVIDPVSLAPLDMATICRSVQKTGRLLVVDNSWTNCGATAEIVAQVSEQWQGSQPVQVKRLGFAPTPCPTTRPLEVDFYPHAASISKAAFGMVRGDGQEWNPERVSAKEVEAFKGPF